MDGTKAETDSQRDQVGIRSECPNDQVAVTTFENGIGASASMEAQLQWKPKEKKRPIPQKKTNAQLRNEKLADIPDLFDL